MFMALTLEGLSKLPTSWYPIQRRPNMGDNRAKGMFPMRRSGHTYSPKKENVERLICRFVMSHLKQPRHA